MSRGAVFLVCGGPSLRDAPLEALARHGLTVAAVNNAPVQLWRQARVRPQLWYSVDSPANFHPHIFQDPECAKHVRRLHCVGDSHVGEGDRSRWKASRTDVRRWEKGAWLPWRPATEFPNVQLYDLDERGFTPEGFLESPLPQWGVPPRKSVLLVALWFLARRFERVYVVGADLHMEPLRPYAWEQLKGPPGCEESNRTLHWLRDEALPRLIPIMAGRCLVRLLSPAELARAAGLEATEEPFLHAGGLYERT